MDTSPPLIAITVDADRDKYRVSRAYADMVAATGGTPVMLPCRIDCLREYLRRCDGFILTGGDDPRMEPWGIPTHPKAKPIDPERQAFEIALLEALENRRDVPVLGVCLGMQLMALHAGGTLDQHLPDTLPTHEKHWGRIDHPIHGELGEGVVHSHHRQAVIDPGTLRVVASSPDGVIEAIRADDRLLYLGVQWHPERTADDRFGLELIRQLVQATSGHRVGGSPAVVAPQPARR